MISTILKKVFQLRYLPFYVILLTAIVYTATNFAHKDWNEKGMKSVIRWDIISYYEYLPAAFIHHDLTLDFVDDPGFVNDNKFWFVHSDNGNKVILTTMGLAFMYSPFFFIAHLVAPLVGQTQDGFSPIYQFSLVFSSLFYVLIGLFIMNNLLRRYFSTSATALTMLLMTLGTNLYNYGTYDGPMSHSYNVVLILALIWSVIRWYQKPTIPTAILTGFLLGLITLIRPTNILAVLLLLLWGIGSMPALRERIIFLWKNGIKMGIMILAFLVPWIPQFIYWHTLTGHLFYNAYQNTGSAFFFGSPHITDILFSYRKGLFVYVPVMLFAVIGLIPLYRRWRQIFWAVAVYFVVMVYVLASWWAWWYGGSFGPRGVIDIYGVMAFPLAAILHTCFERKLALRMGTLAISGILIYMNIFQTWQFQHQLIHYVGMTRQAYWNNFLTGNPKTSFWKKLSIPDFPLARKGIYYYYNTGDTYDAFKKMSLDEARDSVREEMLANGSLMKDIRDFARRNDITADSSLEMVVDHVAEMKIEGQPF